MLMLISGITLLLLARSFARGLSGVLAGVDAEYDLSC